MAWTQMLEQVKLRVWHWLRPPAPAPVSAVPAAPKRTMAEVELPPVVGLNKSKRYHNPECGFVKHAKGQLVSFRSRQDAHEHGLEPCHVCTPSVN
ncbi:MAG: hypothetical protein H7338_02695 [Candidatus Sericytochromatia bacterium]|nr:hypothetical protein [Candidatus Sericytochromatia bacterium]